jgi:hypothetical protein
VELPAELLSGPDLGGGFLFQLTRDRAPLPAGFTFHLQEAGTDAGETVPGSPELLGFRRGEGSCMYGGPGCWHASFPRPESEAMAVRYAYNRLRFVIGPMLRQAVGLEKAPVAEGLRELLGRIGPPLSAAGIPWQIGGSTAAWLAGVPLDPADIDLGVPAGAVEPLTGWLQEYMVCPIHPVGRPGESARPAAAAFVGTLKAGIRVEWAGAVAEGPGSAPEEWGPGWVERRRVVAWEGSTVPVAPLEFQLWRSAAKGRAERARAIARRLGEIGADRTLLEALLRRRPDNPEFVRLAGALLRTPGPNAPS